MSKGRCKNTCITHSTSAEKMAKDDSQAGDRQGARRQLPDSRHVCFRMNKKLQMTLRCCCGLGGPWYFFLGSCVLLKKHFDMHGPSSGTEQAETGKIGERQGGFYILPQCPQEEIEILPPHYQAPCEPGKGSGHMMPTLPALGAR